MRFRLLSLLLPIGSFLLLVSASLARAESPSARGPENPPASPPPPALSAEERRGVVVVEHAGRILALGTLLEGDGRVLTAYSRVAPAAKAQLFVRYPDGKRALARIGHADPDRDLALLVPKVLHTRQGIRASDAAPKQGAALTGFSVSTNRTLSKAAFSLRGHRQAAAVRVLEIAPLPPPLDWGGPLLDTQGRAVAITVSLCIAPGTAPDPAGAGAAAPKAGSCGESPAGLPVSEVRVFLRALPPSADPERAWLGIDGVSADTGAVRGIRIGSIEPKSPASTLSIQASTPTSGGDILVAIAGQPVPTPDALERELEVQTPGNRVDLLVYGEGGYRLLSVRLAERPRSGGR